MKDVLMSTIYASPTRNAQPGETLRGLSDQEAQDLVAGGFGSYVATAAPASPVPERRSPKREKATAGKAATAAAAPAETATAPPPADGKTD